ncbi:hypothetical protein QJS10_CPB15g01687 [Acorus calamus]|uniref:Uncharacterized protein n=1 Tax=Acorus calamus TaxID=4465 RepID=A0AAV9D309_ACOCL|nr:hypothetical protein QJS10_CPB15g01687 [Acorus calamus]
MHTTNPTLSKYIKTLSNLRNPKSLTPLTVNHPLPPGHPLSLSCSPSSSSPCKPSTSTIPRYSIS